MITLIDYKAGNLTSVRKAFTHLGQESVVTEDPAEVRDAQALVLPGVGHFVTCERLATQRRARGRAGGDCARRSFPRHLRGNAVAVCGLHRSAGDTGAWAL